MTEEIIIDKEDKTKKHRNNEIDCLHFCCRKGESGNVLFWCDFYDDHCDNYAGCYYRKYLRLEQENKELKEDYNEISNNSEILHENNRLRIANKRLTEDLWQHGISMREWREQSLKYRSALEEIRIIADDTFKVCDDDCGNARKIKLIIDKINEVLK